MNRKLFLALSFVCLSALPGLAQTAAPQERKADDAMPQFELEEYQFGILRRGAKWEPTTETNKEALNKLQAGHMANIQQMAATGKLFAAGPMSDDSDLRGIFVFKVGSIEAAQALAAADPMIQAERLKLDLHTWWGPKGIGEKLMAEYKTNPQTKMTMTKFYLVLLQRGLQLAADDAPATQAIQREHLWHIKRMMDAKTFVAAGPFDGKSDIRGIFVIAAENLDEAKAIARRDPAVKAGRLIPQVYSWWVAKEVWP